MPGKILIVDDQFGIRILLNEVLHKEGYETFQAANGIQALEVLNNHSPDLVLLDMKIPGMDGIEILKRMKVVDPDIRVRDLSLGEPALRGLAQHPFGSVGET
jgi:two-component system response regulator (stage 0 sporulation protein F)